MKNKRTASIGALAMLALSLLPTPSVACRMALGGADATMSAARHVEINESARAITPLLKGSKA